MVKTNVNKKIGCADCPSKQCFIKRFCDPTWVGIISHTKNLSWYKKGQSVFREGDRVFGLYFILEGKVKVISSRQDGREQIVRIAGDGHGLGHNGYDKETNTVGAVALEDTGICFIDKATMRDALLNNPRLTFELMMFYSTELVKAEVRLRYIAHMNLREKMAECLLSLWEMFGEDELDGSLNINLSRKELADFTGTTTEQISRVLSELEDESLIAKQDKKIALLNTDALNDIIEAHSKNKYLAFEEK